MGPSTVGQGSTQSLVRPTLHVPAKKGSLVLSLISLQSLPSLEADRRRHRAVRTQGLRRERVVADVRSRSQPASPSKRRKSDRAFGARRRGPSRAHVGQPRCKARSTCTARPCRAGRWPLAPLRIRRQGRSILAGLTAAGALRRSGEFAILAAGYGQLFGKQARTDGERAAAGERLAPSNVAIVSI